MTRGPAPVLAGATAIQTDLSDPETLVPLVHGAAAMIHSPCRVDTPNESGESIP
jgi:hypothetical protein